MRAPRFRNEDGSATVEMAISMLIIVPVILYALFLDDLLRFRLDAQEAAVSTVWDLTNLDYQKGSNFEHGVTHDADMMFCNHTSAYDSFDKAEDCNSAKHHKAVAGHVCWLPKGAQQVVCTQSDRLLAANYSLGMLQPANSFADKYTKGGFFSCSAREGVLNYLMPKNFLQQFSSIALTDKKKFSGNVHTAARGAAQKDVFLLAKEQLGIVTDTWALNDSPDVKAGRSGPMHERVQKIYKGNPGWIMYAKDGALFFKDAMNTFLNPLACYQPLGVVNGVLGDNPFDPPVSMVAGSDSSPPPKVNGYYATPWLDWKNNEYQKTWNDGRGQWYMGHRQPDQE